MWTLHGHPKGFWSGRWSSRLCPQAQEESLWAEASRQSVEPAPGGQAQGSWVHSKSSWWMPILQRQVSVCSLHWWLHPGRPRPSRVGEHCQRDGNSWTQAHGWRRHLRLPWGSNWQDQWQHFQTFSASPHQWCHQGIALGWEECGYQEDNWSLKQDSVQAFGFSPLWWSFQLSPSDWTDELSRKMFQAGHLLCSSPRSQVCF